MSAQKSSQIKIVEASAGSGKTRSLAQRYVELLDAAPFQSILAITFSNKAAHEMKERILKSLKSIAFSDSPASRQAQDLMEELFRHYNFFQVTTIDSFINTILSACSFNLGLSANFRIKTDPREYLSYSLDTLIERAMSDKKVLDMFEKFLEQYLYLENRAGWLLKQDIAKVVSQLFFIYNKYRGNFVVSDVKPHDLIKKKKKILAVLNELEAVLPEGAHAGFEKKLYSFLRENKEVFDTDGLSNYFKRKELPVKKGSAVSEVACELWQDARLKIRELVEEEAQAAFCYSVEIFEAVRRELEIIAGDNDVLFLDELNRQASRILKDKALTVPELYLRLSSRLTHFLVDEFQDTSILQWGNISPLIDEALSLGGSFFYVGDKKQAIYRFRGGEVLLFEDVKRGLSMFSPEVVLLSKNYRSQREIVDFCNDIFSQKNLRRFLLNLSGEEDEDGALGQQDIEHVLGIFDGAQQASCDDKKLGVVSVKTVPFANKEDKLDAVRVELMSLFKNIISRFDYKDIAILARENDEVEALTSWFLAENIPVASDKTLNIRNNFYIKEILSFLKFLSSPIDNLSFASFVLGDIFIESCGLKAEVIRDFIFNFKQKKQKYEAAYLYSEFRQQFPDIWDRYLSEFFKNVGFLPVYELIVTIFGRFDCLNRFRPAQGFFMKLLEVVKSHEEEARDLPGFLEYFEKAYDEELYVQAAHPRAVRILTIHKAKGLGFPVVILPFFDVQPKAQTQVAEFYGDKIAFLRLTAKARVFSAKIEALYRNEYKKSLVDELNTAYVALTRAEEELHVIIPHSQAKGENLAVLLTTEKLGLYGRPRESGRFKIDESQLNIVSPGEYQDWISFLKDEFSDASNALNRYDRLRGEVMHAALSFIGNLEGLKADLVLSNAFERTKLLFPYFKGFDEVEKTVKRVVVSRECRQFFYVGNNLIYQEKELVNAFGQTKRIDRLIVKDTQIQIVDFKSSKVLLYDYSAQIKEYADILKSIYPGKKVEGFVVFLDSLEVEEVL